MKAFNIFKLFFLTVVVMSLVVSCNRSKIPPKPDGMPDPVPCSITVQDESGSPIADASVMLLPIEGSNWGASASSNADGVANLVTEGFYKGAVPGKYKVVISKKERVPTGQMDEELGVEILKDVIHIDPVFGGRNTTPLELEVPAGGTSETFKVKKP